MEIKFKELLYISNLLSLLRIALVVPIVYFIQINTSSGNQLLFLIVLVAVATDFFDGYLSRKLNQVTDLGKILDPIADKIAMAIIMLSLIIFRNFPYSLAVFLLYRDALILVLGWLVIKKSNAPVMANFWGKLNTTVVSAACILFMFNINNIFFTILLLSSYALIFLSGFSYLRVGERVLFSRKIHKYMFRLAIVILTCGVVYFTFNIGLVRHPPLVNAGAQFENGYSLINS